VNDEFDRHGQKRAGAVDSADISRRDFLGGAVAVSSLVAAGLPSTAGAIGRRTSRAGAAGDPTPTNVLVSRDSYPSHGEPCLAVNPRDPDNLLAGCELPQAAATYVSFDGGLSWQSNGPLPVPAGFPGGGNLSAGFDGTGRGFVCGLLVAPSGIKGANRSVYVWRTDDGGRTFNSPVALTGLGALDRPWLAVERNWPYTVHVVWSEGARPGLATALGYARSSDGGRTFEAPVTIASDAEGLGDPMVVCGPPGSVYVLYDAGRGAVSGKPDSPSTVTVIRSQDGGQTFGPPIKLGRCTDLVSFPGTTSTSSSLPGIAADQHGGLVCAVFTNHEAGAVRADVLLAASRDGGQTWSRASAVTPRERVIYFQPEVVIDESGRIGVMAFAMNQGMVSVVLMLSEPGSLRFGPPITVTDQPFNPATVADQSGRWWIGNYQALATTPGAFHPLWNDTRTGLLELFTAAVG
jgi:hypothetical protein